MKTVHVVVEKQSDQVLFAKLLDDLASLVHIQFHIANGKHSARPLARALQVGRGEPVAFVLDANSYYDDARMAEAEQLMHESYLNFMAKGVPFIVILIRPSIEEIIFESPDSLSNATETSLEIKDSLSGQAAPKMDLAELGIAWTDRLPRLNDQLNDQQLEALRTLQPIATLRHFVHSITEDPAKPDHGNHVWDLSPNDAELFTDDDSPEDIAEMLSARTDYQAGDYMTFDEYSKHRAERS